MLSVIAGAALAVAFPQEAAPDAAKELSGLAAKIAKAESYQFTTLSEFEGGGFGGRGGRGGAAGGGERPAPTPTKGSVAKGMPMMLASGEVVAYKDGEQVVYKGDDGAWTVFDRAAARGGFGGRGGGERGGGAEGRGGAERGGGERGGAERGGAEGRGGAGGQRRAAPGGGMRGVFTLMGVTAPHEAFKDFAGKVTEVKKEAQGDAAVYTGKLTEEGAQSLGGGRMFGGGRGGRGGGAGGGGPQMNVSGTFTIEVKGDVIQSVKFKVTRSGSFGDRDFEMTSTRTLTFDKVGATKYEVPAEVLSKFEI